MRMRAKAKRSDMGTEKDFRELTPRVAAEILAEKKSLLVLFHVHPDADAAGSAFALKAYFESLGRKAWCICADPMPERLAFISEGMQDSVDIGSVPSGLDPDFIVSVDSASPGQLGKLYESFEGRIGMMIDHHEKGTHYADYCIEAGASSCGELLYRIIENMSEILASGEIPLSVCNRIYSAVSSDTGCFRYSNVKPSTHILASKLIERGIPSADINHKLFGIKTLKQMQVEHAGFERMNLYLDGRLAIITFPYSLKAQYGVEDEHLETLVDVARSVKGVEVAAVVKQPADENRFRISMRSSCDLDVSEICALYGGGGHVRAAGCTVFSDSILAAEMTVVMAVEERLKK